MPKELIREGTYVYVGDDGQPRTLTATTEHLRYWNESGNAMIAANLKIPVPFEHDPTAHPLTPAERLLNNAGEVENFELGTVVDESGQTRNALFSNVDIRDSRAAEKIKDSTIKWTSPWFTSFTDGSGKRWEGVIGHVALTSRPRIVHQQPFDAAFSLEPIPLPPDGLSGAALSRAGLLLNSFPAYPVAFSLWTGAKFAFPDDLKEKSGDDDKGADEEEGEGKKEKKSKDDGGDEEEGATAKGAAEEGSQPKFDPQTGEEIKTPLVDSDGDISVWSVLGDMAAMALGVDLGEEEITAENGPEKLLELFRTAVQQKLAAAETGAGAEAEATETTPPPETGSSNPVLQETQPMYMSLEQVQKITDPTMKSIAMSLFESQKKNKALEQKLFNDAKKARDARITKLKRLMSTEQLKVLNELVAGAKFSLGDDGVVQDPANSWLSLYEGALAQLPEMLRLNSAELAVQPQPTETNGAVSEERIEQVRQEYRRNAGVKA